jgi:hypothetical protein
VATFRFVGRDINIHWNGYDIKGPAGTVFSIPDQLYEEFEGDLRGAEPSLEWLDTNEFQTLTNAVSVTSLEGSFPISVTTTTSGKIVGVTSSTASDGYVLTSNGSGGVAWEPLPGDATGITNIIGTSPISAAVSGTAATISIDQSLLTAGAATTSEALRTYVKNSSGSTISKGQVVYVTGSNGTNALIGLSSASTESGSSKTLGIAANTMTQNEFGYVIENGQLSNIDTSAATAGSSVWLGNTPGSYVFNAPPAEPSHSVYLGVVTKANASTGEILVKVQNGYEIDELHDVFITSLVKNQVLQYDTNIVVNGTTTSGWVNTLIGATNLASNAVARSKILDRAVDASKIDTGAVTSGHISAGAVGSAAIASGSINSTHIGANAVVLGDISAGAVDSSALASNAVVAAKIAAGAVGSTALADNAVVAAKIAAVAVGAVKIDSGTATSGQILTANGSGGASFVTSSVLAALTNISTVSTTVINGSLISTDYASTAAANENPHIAVDKTNNIAYIIVSSTSVKKVDLATNSTMATLTLTGMGSFERATDIAFGSGKVMVVTGNYSSYNQPARYMVIDPSAMTVQNTGNIKGATNFIMEFSRPTVKYDPQYAQFTIHIGTNTSSAAVAASTLNSRNVFRIVHPSTYSTRVHTTTRTAGQSGDAHWNLRLDTDLGNLYYGHPVWFAGASKWVSGRSQSVALFSDNNSSSQFLTSETSLNLVTSGTQSDYVTDIIIDPTSTSARYYTAQISTNDSTSYSAIESFYTSHILSAVSGSASRVARTTSVSGAGIVGEFDVEVCNGTVLIAAGGNVFGVDLGNEGSSEKSLGFYGLDAFDVGTTNTVRGDPAQECGNAVKIFNDGTNNVVVAGREIGNVSRIKKAIIGVPQDFIVYQYDNTSPYIFGRIVTVSNSAQVSYALDISSGSQSATRRRWTADYTDNSLTHRIELVSESTGMTYRLLPDFSGSNAVLSWSGWTVK